jgi:hypothetical protein
MSPSDFLVETVIMKLMSRRKLKAIQESTPEESLSYVGFVGKCSRIKLQ